ncbi:MAG: DNA alkylation repair protein [Bacteroidota bacterium]
MPKNILEQLNLGEIASANLVEWLAIDPLLLLENVLKQTKRNHYFNHISTEIYQLSKRTVNTVNETIGTTILNLTQEHKDDELIHLITNHPSDAVRCWAAYTVGKNDLLTISEKLKNIKPFATDDHFGVREIAWMAVRPSIAEELNESIRLLSTWTLSPNAYIRRFATEATRPRGVWCSHIEALKNNPEIGLTILEPLKSDPEKYVQDSVANWLNDAGKSKPEFVIEICMHWKKISKTKETAYIIKRACRSI